MVALRLPDMAAVPLEETVEKMKSVPLDSDQILTTRDMGDQLRRRLRVAWLKQPTYDSFK